MPRCQQKNTVNNIQGNMQSSEPSYPTNVSREYFNIAKSQEKDVVNNYMKMLDILKK